jgi:hypothetical protein
VGARDVFDLGDGRGRPALKKHLRLVTTDLLEIHGLQESLTKVQKEPLDATSPLGGDLGKAPPSFQVAFDLFLNGLQANAAIAVFGPHFDENVVAKMARGIRQYAGKLNQTAAPSPEDLCAWALWAASLLTVKQRSEFFAR